MSPLRLGTWRITFREGTTRPPVLVASHVRVASNGNVAAFAVVSNGYVTILEGYAGLQLLLGIFTFFLPKETAGKALEE